MGFTDTWNRWPAAWDFFCALFSPLDAKNSACCENAAAQYAVASALARYASDINFDRVCLYPGRMPTEFGVLSVRDASLRAPAIRHTAGYTKWAIENHRVLA